MLIIDNNFRDVEKETFEVVERKCQGHPDSLADSLATICSAEYSKYCLKNFGCILHHNFDKLYIGGGSFEYKNGVVKTKHKIQIVINGRMSTSFGGQKIDLKSIVEDKLKEFLESVMPKINFKKDVNVIYNANNFSQRKNWYTPVSKEDVPDASLVVAGDTSACVVHTGKTTCELLARELERIFFSYPSKNIVKPIYDDIGQDIKIMVTRNKKDIDVTICLPVFATAYKNHEEYVNIIHKYEKLVYEKIKELTINSQYHYTLNINRLEDGSYRTYKTLKGSCIDCGEEGVVGRGNNSRGLISAIREHTMEAPFGKNERYHTGRVLDFLLRRLGDKILNEENCKSSIVCVARNQNPLFEPYIFNINLEKNVERNKIEGYVKEIFNEKYLMDNILDDIITISN